MICCVIFRRRFLYGQNLLVSILLTSNAGLLDRLQNVHSVTGQFISKPTQAIRRLQVMLLLEMPRQVVAARNNLLTDMTEIALVGMQFQMPSQSFFVKSFKVAFVAPIGFDNLVALDMGAEISTLLESLQANGALVVSLGLVPVQLVALQAGCRFGLKTTLITLIFQRVNANVFTE